MRYPPSEKLEIIRLVEQSHLPARKTLEKLGVSRASFSRWCDLYRSGGLEALADKPSRPSRVWNRIPDERRDEIVQLALDEPELSPRELAAGLPRSRQDFFLNFGGENGATKLFGLYSPCFASRPSDGPVNVEVPGFPFYEPQDEGRRGLCEPLRTFLSSGSAPIVFTLGSFAPQVSGDFYDISISAARALGRRAVLLAGPKDAGRLSSSVGPDEFVCSEAPHNELFPFALCVVHHGGIGTTAQALRAGRPQLIIPFFGDQPDHGERVQRLRLGLTLKLSSYNLHNATHALAELCDNRYLRAAQDFALAMRTEHGVEAVADWAEGVEAS